MRKIAAKTVAIFGLIVLFALALATSSWLKVYEPFSGGAMALLAAVGAFWLFRTRRGAVARTAGVLCALCALVASVNAIVHLDDASTERKLAKADDDQRLHQRNAEDIARKLADEEVRKKRELEELKALRASNPDEYLQRLKPLDPLKWLDELKVLRPKQYAAYEDEIRKDRERNEGIRQRADPKEYLTLDYSWRAGGFGTVMIADFVITSRLQFSVKDITIRCSGYGNSGTKISTLSTTLYELVPAQSTKRVNGANVGFIPAQATRASCEITKVVDL